MLKTVTLLDTPGILAGGPLFILLACSGRTSKTDKRAEPTFFYCILTLFCSPGEKQLVNRGYDFTGVLRWFAERADRWTWAKDKIDYQSGKYVFPNFSWAFLNRIILLFDAHKLDISDEFKNAIQVRSLTSRYISMITKDKVCLRCHNAKFSERWTGVLTQHSFQAIRKNEDKIRIVLNKVRYFSQIRFYKQYVCVGQANIDMNDGLLWTTCLLIRQTSMM